VRTCDGGSGKYVDVRGSVRECVSEGWRGGANDVGDEAGFWMAFRGAVDGCRGGGGNSKRVCDCAGSLANPADITVGTGVGNCTGAGGGAGWKGRCGPNSMVASPRYESAVGV